MLRCVFIGDAGVGKTSLIISYSTRTSPFEFVPAVCVIEPRSMILKSQSISLKLTDTSGSTEYDGLRPLAYQKCNVVVLCFSVNDQTSLDNIWNKWFAEVKRHAPHASILLVGLKKDLRSISHDKNNVGQDFVTESSARSLALQMGARAYLECSSRDIESVDALFEVIIELAMESQRSRTCCTML